MINAYSPPPAAKRKPGRPRLSDEERKARQEQRQRDKTKPRKLSLVVVEPRGKKLLQEILSSREGESNPTLFNIQLSILSKDELLLLIGHYQDVLKLLVNQHRKDILSVLGIDSQE